MKRLALLVAVAAASCPLGAFAGPPLPSAPPPPGIDEKGVEANSAPVAEDASMKPAMPDTRLVRDKASRSKDGSAAQIEASSDSVTERKEGSDTVREYRQKGKLRMIRIVPQNGPTHTYYDGNGDGRLDKDPMEGPVAPVYFTIYEWN
ncbi:MAG: DUF2782 domain-containing protein [Xanthomonadales bacterium]|nr:DUF2782 domain-containing protein [Xanthomonadales bacterium]